MAARAIIVHSLTDARAAVAAAAELGVAVTLASAPGAAAYLGPLWFRALVAIVAAEHPGVDVLAVLDCGDKPGHVLAALDSGIRRVRYAGRGAAAKRLAALAPAYGAEVLTGRLPALDLLGQPEPEAACLAWLSRPGRPGRPGRR